MPRRKLQIAEAFAGLTPSQMYNLGQFFSGGSHHSHYSSLGSPLVNYKGGKAKSVAVKVPAGLVKTVHKKRTTKRRKPKPTLAVLYEEQVSRRAPPLVGATSAPKAQTKNNMLATTIAPMVTYVGDPRFNKKASYKKATNRKNVVKKPLSKRSYSSTKSLAKEVKSLKQAINSINSTHTYKWCFTSSLKSLIGRCNHTSWGFSSNAIETFSANLRFYDPAAPATLVTADPNTGTYARDINFKNVYVKLLMRNNYQVPARVKVYLCKVKNDTNDAILTTYTNAITDQVINASVDETDALIHLTDIERVKENWNIDCVVDKVLEPGQEATASHSTGSFAYDPSHLDQNSDIYQKRFKSFIFVVRVEGVLGHDTTVATEQSLLLAGVDTMLSYKSVIEYNSGGADLDDIYIKEDRIQSFTNGGVASLKPIADNIAYSIS